MFSKLEHFFPNKDHIIGQKYKLIKLIFGNKELFYLKLSDESKFFCYVAMFT